MIQNNALFSLYQYPKTTTPMNPNHQTVGGFLRSSVFSLVILGNLLFSIIFLLSLSLHIVKPKDRAEGMTISKKAPPKTPSMVTLANIQQ